MVMLHKAAHEPAVTMKVTVALANALVIKAKFINKNIRPFQATITYKYMGGGVWESINFEMIGHHVKKDGSEGVNTHRWESPHYERARDKVWEELSLPQRWERMLTDAYRPEGNVIIDPTRYEAADIALLHPEVRP